MRFTLLHWIVPLTTLLGLVAASVDDTFYRLDDVQKFVTEEDNNTSSTDRSIKSCNAGTYSVGNACKPCPVGTWSAAKKTECESCPVGQYAYKHLSCKNCAPGSYSEGKWDACKLCGVGAVSRSKAASCTYCTAGLYADQDAFKCRPCKEDTYSPGSVNSCLPCAAGFHSGPGRKACHACTPGEYLDPTVDKCVACAPSFFSPEPYTACRKCSENKYSGSKANTCSSCPAGKKVNASQTGCESKTPLPSPPPTNSPPPQPNTPAPSFSPTSPPSEYSEYQRCKQGLYFDKIKNDCVSCEPGFFTIDSNKPCSRCPYGHYTPPNAVFSLPYGTCTKCSLVMTPDKRDCVQCTGGYYRKVFYDGTDPFPPLPDSMCLRCPEKTYLSYRELSPGGDDTKCVPCIYPGGTNEDQSECWAEMYSPPPTQDPTSRPTHAGVCLRGQEEVPVSDLNPYGCVPCRQSYYSPYPSIPCAPCPAGLYSGYAEATCHKCPPGQTANENQIGCVVVKSAKPTFRPTVDPGQCRAGSYWVESRNVCQKCELGYFSPDPQIECKPCEAGTFALFEGMESCLVCPYVTNRGRTDCRPCERGFFLSRTRIAAGIEVEVEAYCEQCSLNYWSGYNDFCHKCPIGYTSNDNNSGCNIDPYYYNSPTLSPAYTPEPTKDTLPVCTAGSVPIREFARYVCTPCGRSFYQAKSTDTYCTKCPTGLYTAVEGQTVCRGCAVGNTINDFQTGFWEIKVVTDHC